VKGVVSAATAEGLFALALAITACGGSSRHAEEKLDTVDVTSQPDADASLEGDTIATPVGMASRGVAGALPGDFPRDVPLPSPSSLVDFAHRPGDRSVTLEIDLPPDQVRETYGRQLLSNGYRELSDGSWSGHGRTLRFSIAPLHGVARLTVHVDGP